MKQLRRWVFNAMTLLSVLLFVGTAALWARSYRRMDVGLIPLPQFGDGTAGNFGEIVIGRGGVGLQFSRWANWSGEKRLPTRTRPSAVFWRHESIVPPDYALVLFNPSRQSNRGFVFKGFGLLSRRDDGSRDNAGFGFPFECFLLTPLWASGLLWAILPPIYWRLMRKRRRLENRRASGQCTQCGYDLRASPASCPECGATRQLAPAKNVEIPN